MSAIDSYAPPRQGWIGAIWADKARLRRILMIWGVGIFLAIAAAVYLTGGRYVTSDDSYVHANKLMVSTDVSGLVKTVNVREGQQVKAGDILFTLDPQPFEIALENAKANLASTVPAAASTAYARNVLALLALLMPGGEVVLDLDDEVQRAVVVSHGGRVVQPRVRALLEESKEIHS